MFPDRFFPRRYFTYKYWPRRSLEDVVPFVVLLCCLQYEPVIHLVLQQPSTPPLVLSYELSLVMVSSQEAALAIALHYDKELHLTLTLDV